VKDFAEDDAVVFGDINLRNNGPRVGPNGGSLEPGKGGWPTVRYFNKETGYDGNAYTKVTNSKMCEELGGMGYLPKYIQEYGHKAEPEVETSGEETKHDEL